MSTQRSHASVVERLAQKCAVDALSVDDAYPCTELQTALIAASLQGLAQYVSRFIFDASLEEQDSETVRAAFELLHEHNAILRSRFVESKGHLLQVVVRESLQWINGDDVRNYVSDDSQHAVALGCPLTRFGWIQEPDGKSYVVMSVHHSQYDEWSFDLLVNDLNRYLKSSIEPIQRPPFSKFIKAVAKIDKDASHGYWKTNLGNLSICGSICPTSGASDFRTSKIFKKSYTLQAGPDSSYRTPELAICAWSLVMAHLSRAPDVVFGCIMNGRTFDVAGIQDICGPTLATIPWRTNVAYDSSVMTFVDSVRQQRVDLLPYEQTALAEYRRLVGSAAFDTILSIRAGPDNASSPKHVQQLQPRIPENSDLSHPCLCYLDVSFESNNCALKASYDEEWIDSTQFEAAIDAFMVAIQTLTSNLDDSVDNFIRSMDLPNSIELSTLPSNQDLESSPQPSDQGLQLDPHVLAKVQDIVSMTINSEQKIVIDRDTTLMQLGVDSLKTVMLARQLKSTFDTDIPFKQIAGRGKTIADIAKLAQNCSQDSAQQAGKSSGMLLMEVAKKYTDRLASVEISLDGMHRQSTPLSSILLTGATGYLGIEILRQCLAEQYTNVVLLVRCASALAGMDRVKNAAQMAQWNSGELNMLQHVQIWPSDLSKKNLGLSEQHWELLTGPESLFQFKAIIHNGAKVDFLRDYDDMEAANVLSTFMLLEQHLKYTAPPNFVYVTGGRPCPLTPDLIDDTAAKLSNSGGYAQTKFVSEILVHRASDMQRAAGRDCRMSIVHPGAIIGSAHSGVANVDDFIWRYVAASLEMGCYVPAVPTKREWVNLTPADTVAKIIRSCATENTRASTGAGAERHLVRAGLPVGHFWEETLATLGDQGSKLEPVSEWEWLHELKADIERRGPEQPLYSLSQLLLERLLNGIGGLSPASDDMPSVEGTCAVKAALRSNVRYLTSVGGLSNPDDRVENQTMIFRRRKSFEKRGT